MMPVLLATTNTHKITELRRLLHHTALTPVTLVDLDLASLPVEEDGTTFEENATKKAEAYTDTYRVPALADDSGICVDALAGAPGIRSARFGRPNFDDGQRTNYLLQCLDGVPPRQRCAHYSCCLVLARPGRPALVAWGHCYGTIAPAAVAGPTGFGYDPVFIPSGLDSTVSQLSRQHKDQIGHRGKAAHTLVQRYMAELSRSGTLLL
jgi:XTP/dITP diphosphohydrolase